jgi:hypothetical protein
MFEAMSRTEELNAVQRDQAHKILDKFKPRGGTSTIAEKIVEFLLYARKEAPGVFFQPNMIAKAVNSLPRKPSPDSEVTKSIRSAASRSRAIMLEKHSCSLYCEPGRGYRATTDDDDQAKTRVEAAAKRAYGATRTLAAEAAIVDPAKIRDDGRRKWFKGVTAELRALETDSRLDRLLPPKPKEPGA